MQGVAPCDALLNWKVSSKKIIGEVILLVKASDVDTSSGSGQGKKKCPELQDEIKRAFNVHAMREPGTMQSIFLFVVM